MNHNDVISDFKQALSDLENSRCKTAEELRKENGPIYQRFMLTAYRFIGEIALHSKSNYIHLQVLKQRGITTEEDMRNDCILKLGSSVLDRLLNMEEGRRYNYSYSCINHEAVDAMRRGQGMWDRVEFEYALGESGGEKKQSMEERLTDNETPETILIAWENVRELSGQLQEKRAQEHDALIEDLILLEEKPGQMVANLGAVLGDKPRELAALLENKGRTAAVQALVEKAERRFRLEDGEQSAILAGLSRLTDRDLRLGTDPDSGRVHTGKELAARQSKLRDNARESIRKAKNA